MRILLVDEQAVALRTMKDFLTGSGHDVFTSHSISEAIERNELEKSQIDVIILDAGDVKEGVMDAVEKAHFHFPDADTLLMDRVHFDSQYARSRDVFAFVRKPLRLDELDLLLVRIMQKRGLER